MWKTIQEHYNIKHLVTVESRREYGNVPCIFIGSPYIHDIIVIRVSDGKLLKRYNSGKHTNELLYNLQPKLDADEQSGKLKELIDAKDTFEKLLPVYDISDYKHIRLRYCEQYGYPNVTTEGLLMYDNQFYSQRRFAQVKLREQSKIYWRMWWNDVRNNLYEAMRQLRLLKYHFRRVWVFVYVNCWGQFFVKKEG